MYQEYFCEKCKTYVPKTEVQDGIHMICGDFTHKILEQKAIEGAKKAVRDFPELFRRLKDI